MRRARTAFLTAVAVMALAAPAGASAVMVGRAAAPSLHRARSAARDYFRRDPQSTVTRCYRRDHRHDVCDVVWRFRFRIDDGPWHTVVMPVKVLVWRRHDRLFVDFAGGLTTGDVTS